MGMFENSQWLGIFALMVFFLFFLGVIAWVFRPGSKEKYDAMGSIPLKGDDELSEGR